MDLITALLALATWIALLYGVAKLAKIAKLTEDQKIILLYMANVESTAKAEAEVRARQK